MMKYLIFYFNVYAFLGWCTEVTYHQLKKGKFINRGMLAGPYCPIYGFGMILLIIFTKPFEEKFFAVFFASVFLCSLLELVSGFLLDKIFHERWWDYSEEPMNIRGYICLRFSIMWGFGGAIVIKEIHPLIENFAYWLADELLMVAIVAFSVGMLVDTVLTIGNILGLNRQVDELIEIQKNLRKISDRVGKQISENTAKSSSRIQAILENPEFQNKINSVHENLNYTQKRLLKSYPNLRGTKSELQEKILKSWSDKSMEDEMSNKGEI
ncbi:putative membrane protein [Peptoniphilus sp. ING2-D1G]|nr:putative membrane protein [Peptoniphilus sp. ING2-D1G]